MEVLLQSIIEVMATEEADIIVTSISHFILLVGIIYTFIHLVRMMFEHEENDIELEEPIMKVEKLIS